MGTRVMQCELLSAAIVQHPVTPGASCKSSRRSAYIELVQQPSECYADRGIAYACQPIFQANSRAAALNVAVQSCT